MPLYEFKCRRCGLSTTTMEYGVIPECEVCKGSMAKLYSFHNPVAFQPHYNVSVGRYVTSKADFHEALKTLSAKQTERTGIYHNYVEADMSDRDAFGVDHSGDDNYAKGHDGTFTNDPDARTVLKS